MPYQGYDGAATTLIAAPFYGQKKKSSPSSAPSPRAKAPRRRDRPSGARSGVAGSRKARNVAGVGSRPKKPKGKKPCKYGPRDSDGYCPPRPSSGYSGGSGNGSGRGGGFSLDPSVALPLPRRRRSSSRRTGAAQRAVQNVVRTGATRAAAAATKKGSALGKKLVAPAVLTAGTVSIALAAGLASYAATTAVLRRIRDRKERRAQSRFEAAQAYRIARAKAEERLGRPLKGFEHQELAAAFKARLKEIG